MELNPVNRIEKKQQKVNNFKLNSYYFKRARDSFEYILKNFLFDKKVLIPAYIGYSSNEGSGIFDPIKNSGIKYQFYKLTKTLNIDKEHLFKLIDKNPGNVLLLVHYFGFLDDSINEIKKYARNKNMIIVEDCAHAFFTFFQKPIVDSDYYIFSLHKMFSYEGGGMLLARQSLDIQDDSIENPYKYNLFAISDKRVQNYNYLQRKIQYLDHVKILKPSLQGTVPQTLPILVSSEAMRDNLYFKLNELGFGVVSLYHELIPQIDTNLFKIEKYISSLIINLPIHQDVEFSDLDKMVGELKRILNHEA